MFVFKNFGRATKKKNAAGDASRENTSDYCCYCRGNSIIKVNVAGAAYFQVFFYFPVKCQLTFLFEWISQYYGYKVDFNRK